MTKPATKRYSIAEAKNQLSRLVHEAEADSLVELTRRGRPVAVVISIDEYHRLANRPRKPLWEAINEFRSVHDMTSEDLSEAFENVRSPDVGRDFRW